MFGFFKKNRIQKYINGASSYIDKIFVPATPPEIRKTESQTQYQVHDTGDVQYQSRRTSDDSASVRYSRRNDSAEIRYSTRDSYDFTNVQSMLRSGIYSQNFNGVSGMLRRMVNQTFVEKVSDYINKKGLRDSSVYKAAQIDRRLFSKIMSDSQYKPSKDTAVAIALALNLTLSEANDLLSRAGYTLSHSNKRDIVIEYFFRERVYNIIEINLVLESLGEKPIGR